MHDWGENEGSYEIMILRFMCSDDAAHFLWHTDSTGLLALTKTTTTTNATRAISFAVIFICFFLFVFYFFAVACSFCWYCCCCCCCGLASILRGCAKSYRNISRLHMFACCVRNTPFLVATHWNSSSKFVRNCCSVVRSKISIVEIK